MSGQRTAQCKWCKESIVRWARDKNNAHPLPLEMRPSPDGTLLLDLQRGVYEQLKGDDLDRARARSIPLFRSHSSYCKAKPIVPPSKYDRVLLGLEEEEEVTR